MKATSYLRKKTGYEITILTVEEMKQKIKEFEQENGREPSIRECEIIQDRHRAEQTVKQDNYRKEDRAKQHRLNVLCMNTEDKVLDKLKGLTEDEQEKILEGI